MSPLFRTQIVRLFFILFLMLGFLFILILLNTRTKRAVKETDLLEKKVIAARSRYDHLLAENERAYRPQPQSQRGLEKLKPEEIKTVRFTSKPEMNSASR